MLHQNDTINPRRSITPSGDDTPYILADSAPPHYVRGFGLINAGSIFSMRPDEEPSPYAMKLSQEDAAKAVSDEGFAAGLAAKASEEAQGKISAQKAKLLNDANTAGALPANSGEGAGLAAVALAMRQEAQDAQRALAAATSDAAAKDAEIARLTADLEAARAAATSDPKPGPKPADEAKQK